MKLTVNIRRASLPASILAACFVCLASSAGCGSCAGDDAPSTTTSSPVNGSGGPGSKPRVVRRPTMRMNGTLALDSGAADPASSASAAPTLP